MIREKKSSSGTVGPCVGGRGSASESVSTGRELLWSSRRDPYKHILVLHTMWYLTFYVMYEHGKMQGLMFPVMMLRILAFCCVTSCSRINRCWHFKGMWCLHLQGCSVMEEYCISKDFTPLKTKAIGSFRMLRSVNRATQCNISKEQNSQHGKNSYGISFSATYSTKLAKGMLHNATHKTSNGILYSLFKLTTACSSI